MFFSRRKQLTDLEARLTQLEQENESLKAKLNEGIAFVVDRLIETQLPAIIEKLEPKAYERLADVIDYPELAKYVPTYHVAEHLELSNADCGAIANKLDVAEIAGKVNVEEIAEELAYKVDSDKVAKVILASDWAREELPEAITAVIIDKLASA